MKRGDIIKFVKSEYKNPCQGTEGEILRVYTNKVQIRFLDVNAEKNAIKGVYNSINTYYKKFLEEGIKNYREYFK